MTALKVVHLAARWVELSKLERVTRDNSGDK